MGLGPGTQVTPNVRLVELLGEGGMGSVWVADHSGLATRVAVKFVSTALVKSDPSLVERFTREAALTAKIRSPHVVQTFDHGVMPDGQAYIVMELLEGESLAERLDREGRISPEETCLVVQQTAKGLARAHKVGIVHRDIKPENLFLVDDEDGLFVKVLDFGIAKQTSLPKADNVTGTNMMVGTPEYMSPEQVLSAKNVSPQADLWSLAIVAYRCLTSGVPFSGETVGALAVAISKGEFVPPSRYRRELRPGVDSWFVRALAQDPSARFADAKELARTFAAAILGAEALLSPDASGAQAAASSPLTPSSTPPLDGPPLDRPEGVVAPGRSSPTFSGATLSATRTKGRRTVMAVLAVTALIATVAISAAIIGSDGETAAPAAPPPTLDPPPFAESSPKAAADQLPERNDPTEDPPGAEEELEPPSSEEPPAPRPRALRPWPRPAKKTTDEPASPPETKDRGF